MSVWFRHGVSKTEVSSVQTRASPSSKKLTVSFDGFRALNELTLHVDAGELLCIIGPNGAGKTTMMDVITGKTRPDSGAAHFGDDIDLLKMSEPEIVAAGIGRKFQKPTVFERLTVFENLELALAGTRPSSRRCVLALRQPQEKRIDQVLGIIGLANQRMRSEERSPMVRSSGSKSVCC